MTKQDHEYCRSSSECWICKTLCKEGDVEVKDHDKIIIKYRRTGHQECNLNLSLSKKNFYCVS